MYHFAHIEAFYLQLWASAEKASAAQISYLEKAFRYHEIIGEPCTNSPTSSLTTSKANYTGGISSGTED